MAGASRASAHRGAELRPEARRRLRGLAVALPKRLESPSPSRGFKLVVGGSQLGVWALKILSYFLVSLRRNFWFPGPREAAVRYSLFPWARHSPPPSVSPPNPVQGFTTCPCLASPQPRHTPRPTGDSSSGSSRGTTSATYRLQTGPQRLLETTPRSLVCR